MAAVCAATALAPPPLRAQRPPAIESLVEAILFSDNAAAAKQAEAALEREPSWKAASRTRFHDLEAAIRQGRSEFPPPPQWAWGEFQVERIDVTLPGGETLPVLVQLPPGYRPSTAWPLILAMHGGPPGSVEQAWSGARRMLRVWKEAAASAGWIVASPALTTVASRGARTPERLPYEVLHPEQMEAILAAMEARFRVDPDRMISTGISLGSNFSIAFGCARPDRFAAIVPVSTEGDSREHLLRNLIHVPVYVLEGTQDRNIRTISGPNALRDILVSFGYPLTYREFSDRAHEGFQEHYPDVLRSVGRRDLYPREVVRVPHAGVVPVSRRVHWVEADTRQALVRAVVVNPHRVDVTARWARELTLYLHDRLLDLDHRVEVWVNGSRVKEVTPARSARFALDEVKRSGDPGRIFAAAVSVPVPQTADSVAAARALSASLAPGHPEGTLSFWEDYAVKALLERFPGLGFEAEEADASLAGEQVALKVTRVDATGPFAKSGLRAGDLLLEVGGEPAFTGRGPAGLHHWLLRELRGQPRDYALVVRRDGKRLELTASLALGPYRE